MKIFIKERNNKPIKLVIPNGLFMNRFVANIGATVLKQTDQMQIDSKDINQLFKALKESKKIFGNYCLVEVESKDEIVRIEL